MKNSDFDVFKYLFIIISGSFIIFLLLSLNGCASKPEKIIVYKTIEKKPPKLQTININELNLSKDKELHLHIHVKEK